MHKVISVFGGSSPRAGEPAYEQARQVGRLLARAGLAVATGGYSGTMSAVSQGAAEANGHVIGVTSAQIERFRPLAANPWVREEIRYETLRDRLLHLVTQNDGMIVLPGGIGTLSEMTLAWSFLQVGEISPRPLVLLGDLWRATIASFHQPEYVREPHLHLLQFAMTPAEAVRAVMEA
ncbi:MAG: LOG family protein [Anaerolineales bacterium]|nr:LOG family protein [Anaerolineales bacterium]MCB8951758.1 LOG family protein [Ardenticatenales bacterium]